MPNDSQSTAITAESYAGGALGDASGDTRIGSVGRSALGFGLAARLGFVAALLALSWVALSWAMA